MTPTNGKDSSVSGRESYPDLLCGVGPWHIRILCDNTFEGGFGKSFSEVADMTLDQVFMMFANKKCLRKGGTMRNTKMTPLQVVDMVDAEGYVKGKDAEGNSIKAKIGGKSLARRYMEELESKKKRRK